jgi:formylglycine-generating enzyme required for sulfatase activity
MKFHCTNCDKRMKSDGAFGAGGGAMSVAAFCPNCGNRFALWANPGETLLLKALNAGLSGGELMTQVLESAQATLTHAVDQAPMSESAPSVDWRDLAEEWVPVDPGSFVMGSPESEAGRDPDESPQHNVTISAGFDLGKYPVTRGQWEEVMRTAPWEGRSSGPSSPTLPAAFISWNDVEKLISRLNAADGDWRYRLPTEAEWEYACRAGTTAMWSFGEDRHALGDYAWYVDSEAEAEDQTPREVGTKRPNPWGLHDMHGNVWEWCQDVYGEDYYRDSSAIDPRGPDGGPGSSRVARGGYFRYFTRHSRSASRNTRRPDERHRAIGVRLVRT